MPTEIVWTALNHFSKIVANDNRRLSYSITVNIIDITFSNVTNPMIYYNQVTCHKNNVGILGT